jgi:hypothetical protein
LITCVTSNTRISGRFGTIAIAAPTQSEK